MHGFSGFAVKLNVQNCVYSMGNCVHYMYTMFGFAEELIIQNCVNVTGNCVHYMCEMTQFAEKLNIKKSLNSTEIVFIICTKCLDLQKN